MSESTDVEEPSARERFEFEKAKAAADERLKLRELDIKEKELEKYSWLMPTFFVVLAAVIGLIGNWYTENMKHQTAVHDSEVARDLERDKLDLDRNKADAADRRAKDNAEQSRAFEAIKGLERCKAIENLRFLADLGLYHDQGQIIHDRVCPNPEVAVTTGSAPNGEPFQLRFSARSAEGGTTRQCIDAPSGTHFENWRIEKKIIGDGDAWFEKQTPAELCVRADASVTGGGRNSGVEATMTAMRVPGPPPTIPK